MKNNPSQSTWGQGAWSIRKNKPLDSIKGTEHCFGVFATTNGSVFWQVAENLEERDAALCAAAPELLEACKEVLSELEEHTPDRHIYSKELLKKAIAKAERGE